MMQGGGGGISVSSEPAMPITDPRSHTPAKGYTIVALGYRHPAKSDGRPRCHDATRREGKRQGLTPMPQPERAAEKAKGKT